MIFPHKSRIKLVNLILDAMDEASWKMIHLGEWDTVYTPLCTALKKCLDKELYAYWEKSGGFFPNGKRKLEEIL